MKFEIFILLILCLASCSNREDQTRNNITSDQNVFAEMRQAAAFENKLRFLDSLLLSVESFGSASAPVSQQLVRRLSDLKSTRNNIISDMENSIRSHQIRIDQLRFTDKNAPVIRKTKNSARISKSSHPIPKLL